MIIGTFTYDRDADSYRGEIQTLTLHRPAVMLRPQTRVNDREPDYRVFGETGQGEVEFGAAWQRRSDKGQEYLSILLDDPALEKPLNAALFVGEGGAANLVWSRPPARQAAVKPEERPALRGRMKSGMRGAPAQG